MAQTAPRMTNAVQVEVDFGHPDGGETTMATASVDAPWVSWDTPLVCCPVAMATADHDPEDVALEGIVAYPANVQPGVGFDVVATATSGGTWGRYLVNVIRGLGRLPALG